MTKKPSSQKLQVRHMSRESLSKLVEDFKSNVVCIPDANDRLLSCFDEYRLWKPEFYDLHRVLEMGANKYSADGWLESDGSGTSLKEMYASMFRHLAKSTAGISNDDESGLDHLLHLACRALMAYTRKTRNIYNSKD